MCVQVPLEPGQYAKVEQQATTFGISVAEYIRWLVERDVGSSNTHPDPLTIIGIGRSGGSEIAAEGKSAAAAIVEVLERAGGRTGGNIGREAAVAAVRAERDAR